jgi:hypothetical protein
MCKYHIRTEHTKWLENAAAADNDDDDDNNNNLENA